jgi:hypothetical protein
MSREVRVLIFEQAEVFQALTLLRRKAADPLPPGSVLRFIITDTSDVGVTLEVADLQEKRHLFIFPSVEVAAALVGFCMDKRIPLPAKAKKQLKVMDGNVAMVISKSEEWAQRLPATLASESRAP